MFGSVEWISIVRKIGRMPEKDYWNKLPPGAGRFFLGGYSKNEINKRPPIKMGINDLTVLGIPFFKKYFVSIVIQRIVIVSNLGRDNWIYWYADIALVLCPVKKIL